jgi:hypothetical protein
VDSYNRNRPVNKLHVVELRTDRKLGGIIKHEPLSAQVSAQRVGEGADAQLVVELQDVVSPTIMQRLNLEQGVFRAQITDWRAVVDCILIDTQFDGQVFNVTLADVPERKQDLVNGRYELPAPPAGRPWRSRSSTCWARSWSSPRQSEPSKAKGGPRPPLFAVPQPAAYSSGASQRSASATVMPVRCAQSSSWSRPILLTAK